MRVLDGNGHLSRVHGAQRDLGDRVGTLEDLVGQGSQPPKRLRWLRRAAPLSAIIFIAASLRLFAFPPVDSLRQVDAIVMLGGGGDRGPRAVDLLDTGWSDTIVFASAYDEATATWATRPCNPGLNDLRAEVICFRPEPGTTRGEVRAVADLAEARGWDQILVVTSDDQITRARLLFDRCWAGSAFFPGGVRHPWWPVRIAYEWGATVKALTIRRSC